ncbi:hypothetical protein ACQEVI_26325 [Promicromonospora sp. CA-289599]|uniref:hypothetical protein n=1 Tax=Promicromonospora sp. CA-289599 TaxID=3240014 RepID=UPI003D8B26F8
MELLDLNWTSLTAETKVALVAAGIALLVGFAGPFVSWWTTSRTLKAQRRMAADQLEAQRKLAADERVWEERRKVGADLLEWAASLEDRVKKAHDFYEDLIMRGQDPDIVSFIEEACISRQLEIRVRAYCSDEVKTAEEAFSDAAHGYATLFEFGEAGRALDGEPPSDELNAAIGQVWARQAELAEKISNDIVLGSAGRP